MILIIPLFKNLLYISFVPRFSGRKPELRTGWYTTSILSNYTKVIIMFKKIPINKMSLAKKSLINGKGINDADYKIRTKEGLCPFYQKWQSMIKRCYAEEFHKYRPTYKDCSVCEEWLLFSNFKDWMINQDWENKQLDKDILGQGNKIYSPEYCIFVTSEINNLIITEKKPKSGLPSGVSKSLAKFSASITMNSKKKHIGNFDTPEEASIAYKQFKYKLIAEIANKQTEPLKSALLAYKLEGDLCTAS